MELKVINEITTETKQFKSIEEFNLYYQKHKDDMNNQTTQYLNRVYKIITPDGVEYKITKKNCSINDGKRVGGDIFLRKVNQNNSLKELQEDVLKADIENVKNYINLVKNDVKSNCEQIDEINKKINELKSTVNQIGQYINQLIQKGLI